jgi:glycosyltransferase involved in cell wall biosynthesis
LICCVEIFLDASFDHRQIIITKYNIEVLDTVKPRVLFIGAFDRNGKRVRKGGQYTASMSLLNSELSNYLLFKKFDLSILENSSNLVINRIFKNSVRLIRFFIVCLIYRPNYALVFSPNGYGFYEKAIMCWISSNLGIMPVFAARGGALITEYENSRITRFFVRLVMRNCSKFICQGIFMQNFFLSNPEKRHDADIVIVPNWIDLNPFKGYERSNYAISDFSELKILFLGAVVKEKGIFDIIEALFELRASNLKISMIFAGDGEDLIEAKNRCAILFSGSKISTSFLGWVDGKEKMQLLNYCNIFLLPSYFEGLPNSILEAMAVRLPVIATRVGEIPSVIDHLKNGILIDTGSISGIVDGILFLYNNPKAAKLLTENGMHTIKEHHTIESAVKSLKRLIN